MTLTGKYAAINFYSDDVALLDKKKKGVDLLNVSPSCLNSGSVLL